MRRTTMMTHAVDRQWKKRVRISCFSAFSSATSAWCSQAKKMGCACNQATVPCLQIDRFLAVDTSDEMKSGVRSAF